MPSFCNWLASSHSSCLKPKKRSESRQYDEGTPSSRTRHLAPHSVLPPAQARQRLATQVPDRRSAPSTSLIRLPPSRYSSHNEPQEGEASDEHLLHQGVSQEGQEMAQNNEYQGDLPESPDDHARSEEHTS